MNCAYASSFDCCCCCGCAGCCSKGPPRCWGCCGGRNTSVMGSICRCCFFANFTFVGTKRVTSVRRFLKMSLAQLRRREEQRELAYGNSHRQRQARRCIMRMRALRILGEELAPISRNLIDKCRSHESITTNHQNGAPKCRVVYIANTPTRLSAAACSQICRLVSRNTCFV